MLARYQTTQNEPLAHQLLMRRVTGDVKRYFTWTVTAFTRHVVGVKFIIVGHMALWTFIADYRGGTYISQVKAGNVRQALVLWAKSFPHIQGSKIGVKTRAKLTSAAMEHREKPVRIKETQSVWYWNPLSVRPPIIVHAIKTARF